MISIQKVTEEGEELFKDVKVDPDTTIHLNSYTQIEAIPLMLQTWSWDGVVGTSAIIPQSQIEFKSDDEVLELLRRGKLDVQKPYTIVRNSNGFCFVNFEFII